jgi:hypothetical protein
MSNDLIKSIQSSLALATDGGVDDDTRAVAGNAQGKRISIKGGVFRKMAGGKEVGTIEDRHMEVIFVRMAHDPERKFFTRAFKEGENVAPVCWSSNSKTPDEGVEQKQSDSCSTCSQAVKGSGNAGQGTACRLAWRTAVVLPKDPDGDVMQLVLPATSVFGDEDNGRWPFRAYIRMLANNNISAGRVTTKMQFDTKSATPKLLFNPVGVVPPEHVEIIKAKAKSAEAEQAIKLTVFKKKDEEGEAPAQAAVPEPVLRQDNKATEATPPKDVPDIIKKWTKPK